MLRVDCQKVGQFGIRRYGHDVRPRYHHLADEPVVARPPGRSYLLRKFARKHRAAVEQIDATVPYDLKQAARQSWDEAIALGDDIAVIADGRVRQVGPVQDVFRWPAEVEVARSIGVETLLPARIVGADNGLLELAVGTATLRALDAEADSWPERNGTDVVACIRAEDVTLLPAAATAGSARNHLTGRVTAIEADGPVERVSLDCGFPLVALVTRQAREQLALSEGVTLVAAIKATAVHVVPRT